MNKEIVYWKQKDGKLVSIDDMDTNHLRNVLKMIVNNSNKHKDKLEKEAYWKKQNEKVFLNGDIANEFKALEGIISLIDHIQDEAVEQLGLDENEVFDLKKEEE